MAMEKQPFEDVQYLLLKLEMFHCHLTCIYSFTATENDPQKADAWVFVPSWTETWYLGPGFTRLDWNCGRKITKITKSLLRPEQKIIIELDWMRLDEMMAWDDIRRERDVTTRSLCEPTCEPTCALKAIRCNFRRQGSTLWQAWKAEKQKHKDLVIATFIVWMYLN